MKKRRIKRVKLSSLIRISFLPSVFTILNLFLGFQALLYVIGKNKNFKTAVYYLTASVIMDGFDGTIARLTKTESNFGVQLDSLVDAVTFGLVTSILAFTWGFQSGYARIGMIICFVFLSAGLIRLARFNIFKEANAFPANIFIGVPIPTASMAIGSAALVFGANRPQGDAGTLLFSLYIVLIALLMISNIKYKTIKKIALKNNLKALFLMAVIIACLVIFPDYTIPVLTATYLLSPLFFSLFSRKSRSAEPSAPSQRTEAAAGNRAEA